MIPLGKTCIHAFVISPALQNSSGGSSSNVHYDGYSYSSLLHQVHPVYTNTYSTVEPTPSHVTIPLRQERTLTPQQEDFFTSLSSDLYGHAFIERLMDLQEYANINGHCLVPKRYAPNKRLGNWVNKTRQMYRKYQEGEKSSLTRERIDILEEMGFQFRLGTTNTGSALHDHQGNDAESNDMIYTSPSYLRWMKNYQYLKDIYEKNPLSTSSYKSQHPIDDSIIEQEDPKLKKWVLRQRREYQKFQRNEKSSLNSQLIDLLDTIDFIWSPREEKWNLRILQLQEFKSEYGHCRVPVQYERNPPLGRWVSAQRKHYKLYQMGENVSMSQDRIQQLSKMGFVWNHWDFDSEKWQIN